MKHKELTEGQQFTASVIASFAATSITGGISMFLPISGPNAIFTGIVRVGSFCAGMLIQRKVEKALAPEAQELVAEVVSLFGSN